MAQYACAIAPYARFADLGLPNANEHLIKADMVLAIAGRIRAKGLTQVEVSKLIDAPLKAEASLLIAMLSFGPRTELGASQEELLKTPLAERLTFRVNMVPAR
ncbi:MAG: hypothetical protein ACREDC_01250 [Bradyrhizobium sp.]